MSLHPPQTGSSSAPLAWDAAAAGERRYGPCLVESSGAAACPGPRSSTV